MATNYRVNAGEFKRQNLFREINLKARQSYGKRAASVGRFLSIGVLFFMISIPFLFPQLFSCELIRFSDFREVYGNVFVSPEMKRSQLGAIQKKIKAAEMRVDSFYSGRIAKPVIVICNTAEQYEKYCNRTEGAGCSLGTPWGHSFIVLNADGLNVDVIGHEMSHIELLTKIGWWKTLTQIPQWFNEGIALMVDRRFVNNPDRIGRYLNYTDEWLYYTGGGQQILELQSIGSLKGFFEGNQSHAMLAYMTSGLEVSYWLIYAGENGIIDLAMQMKQGRSFAQSYREIEKSSKVSKIKALPVNPLRLPDPGPLHK